MLHSRKPAPKSVIVDEHELVDWDRAPGWATHAGRDDAGWYWYDHHPWLYDSDDFCRGVLGNSGEPHGRCDGFHGQSGSLLVVPRPSEKKRSLAVVLRAAKKQADKVKALKDQLEREERVAAKLAKELKKHGFALI